MTKITRMGEAYSSGDVTVTLAGDFDVNPNAIKYEYTYEHQYEYGLRRDPARYRMGKKGYTSSITLSLDYVAKLERKYGDIAKIRPFPINVAFFNAENFLIRDFLRAKFTGNGRDVSVDNELSREYEIFVTEMDLNQK